MKQTICSTCGNLGKPKTSARGSLLGEIGVWIIALTAGVLFPAGILLFILAAFIYSIYRLGGRKKICRECGSDSLVPTDTPRGIELINTYHKG